MNLFTNILPKLLKVFRYWVVGYSAGIIIQRLFLVIIAYYYGYSHEVSPINKITNSAAYELSLPLFALFNLPIFVLSAYVFFIDDEFENPNEIYKQGLELVLFFTLMTFVADMLIWVILPMPAQVNFLEFFQKNGFWQVIKYIIIAGATFLGVRPFYVKKAKSIF